MYSICSMNGSTGILSIHHAGKLDEGPPKFYHAGKVESIPIDGDYLRLDAIWNVIVKDLRYPKEEVKGLYYKGPCEDFMDLTQLDGDDHIRYMLGIMKVEGEVEVFIDHGEFLPREKLVEEDGENDIEGDGPDLPYGPNQVDGLECGSMVEGRLQNPVVVEIEDPIQGTSFVSGDDIVEAEQFSEGEVDGPMRRAGPELVEDEVPVGNEVDLDNEDDLDDWDFELDENELDSDLGTPNGSDAEHVENVSNARETIARCTGLRRRSKRNRRRRDPNASHQAVEEIQLPKGRMYKKARWGRDPEAPEEYDRVSNGSTDIGSGYDSDNPGQLNQVVEGEDFVPINEKWFDTKKNIPLFACGMMFRNQKEVRDAMANYAIKKCYAVKCSKGCTKKLRFKCRKTCPWQIYVVLLENTQTWQVRTYSSKHNCHHEYNSPLATQFWLAEYLEKRIKAQPFFKISELRKELKNELHLEPTYEKVARAKKIVLKQMVGNYRDEYASVRGYADYLKSVNPGNVVRVDVSRRNAAPGTPLAFQGMYFCFDAIKKGWKNGCRPIIGLDGCHLKGICKGQLLVAVGRDAEDHVYPIAWQVVEVESYDTWANFLRQLSIDFDLGDGSGITVCSDRHKGLMKARRDVLKNAAHRHCARHLFANWAKRHRGADFRPVFWRCVNAAFKEDLDNAMKFLRTKTVPGYQELASLQGHNWTKAQFDEHCKCDIPHNNLSESFNSLILPARCLPIVSMSEWIYDWCLKKRGELLNQALKWTTPLVPRAMQKLRVNSLLARHCTIVPGGKTAYRVHDHLRSYVHSIDMDAHKCSCRTWQLSGIPCQHALACVKQHGCKPEDLVSPYFTTEMYIKTYQDELECTRGPEMWSNYDGEKVEAPVMVCGPGRPRKTRFKCRGEVKKVGRNKTVMSRVGQKLRCSVCRSEMHTKRKCPHK